MTPSTVSDTTALRRRATLGHGRALLMIPISRRFDDRALSPATPGSCVDARHLYWGGGNSRQHYGGADSAVNTLNRVPWRDRLDFSRRSRRASCECQKRLFMFRHGRRCVRPGTVRYHHMQVQRKKSADGKRPWFDTVGPGLIWADGEKFKPGNSRGDRWNTGWVDDTSNASNLRLVPDENDKICDSDAPNIDAGFAEKTFETYNNFLQWVEWNGERASNEAPWHWQARWKKTKLPM